MGQQHWIGPQWYFDEEEPGRVYFYDVDLHIKQGKLNRTYGIEFAPRLAYHYEIPVNEDLRQMVEERINFLRSSQNVHASLVRTDRQDRPSLS
jgi:hypothetical protein